MAAKARILADGGGKGIISSSVCLVTGICWIVNVLSVFRLVEGRLGVCLTPPPSSPFVSLYYTHSLDLSIDRPGYIRSKLNRNADLLSLEPIYYYHTPLNSHFVQNSSTTILSTASMPTLRKLTSRIWTAIAPSPPSSSSSSVSSPTSPTSRPNSSFSVISSRKGAGVAVTRLDQQHARSYSLMTYATNSSKETMEDGEKRPQRRMSRFREELWDE